MTPTPPPAWAVRTAADRKALADGYYWDADRAERVLRFAERYISPKFTAGAFRLFEWQRRFLMSLYGWRRPDGGRRWALAILHVPKKNGKTLLVSVIASYELFGRICASPLVVSASTTKDNAKQVYDQLATAITRNDTLKAVSKLVPSKKTITVPDREAEFKSLSADAPNAEGANGSAVIVDEAHAHRSPKLFNALEHAQIGQLDGIMVVISTAGDDLTHFYFDMVKRARRIAAGEDLDPTTYAEVYEVDPERQDLDDPATWKAANPSLDQYPGFTSERFRLAWEKAKTTTRERLNFERYRMNIFRRAEDNTWIDLNAWDACRGAVDPAALVGRPLFLGFDASQRIDPTSLSAVWVLPDRKFAIASWAWVADGGVREREKSNLPRYQQFAAEGSMVITPGDTILKSGPLGKVRELLAAGQQVKGFVMDPNGAWVIADDLVGLGIDPDIIYRQPQSHRWFNGPTREIETAVVERRVVHDGNGWTRWCVHSVRLDEDRFENVRPIKSKSADHIDGAVALLMAFALADAESKKPPPKPSAYEKRGILVF